MKTQTGNPWLDRDSDLRGSGHLFTEATGVGHLGTCQAQKRRSDVGTGAAEVQVAEATSPMKTVHFLVLSSASGGGIFYILENSNQKTLQGYHGATNPMSRNDCSLCSTTGLPPMRSLSTAARQ